MSWLARSVANTLRLEEEDDEDDDVVPPIPSDLRHSPSTAGWDLQQQQGGQNESELEDEALSRGVKEDLTEFKQTLTRQFWGVASFLAPLPSHSSKPSHPRPDLDQASPPDGKQFEPSNQSDLSISGDEAEPSDPVAGLKMRSNHDAYALEHLREECYEDDWGGAVGITEEVLTFATNIAMHPETWIDFPLDEEEDNDDFEMSGAQREHTFTIERLAPRLAALRIELCPCHMTESYFWKVYFVLLHSRLNKHDAEVLSTPQVAAARSMWMQELQKQTKLDSNLFGRNTFELRDSSAVLQENINPMSFHEIHSESTLPWTFTSEPSVSSLSYNYESDKHQMDSLEMQFVDKSVIVEKPSIKDEDKNLNIRSSSKLLIQNYEDESDDWLEEDSELGGCNGTILPLENEEDISFSDLDDDDMILPTKFKIALKE